MQPFSIQSPAEQVAQRLVEEIRQGTWNGEMPGAPRLARELAVDAKTVLGALGLLEKQGILIGQGVGRRRRIVPVAGNLSVKPLKIGILLNHVSTRRVDYVGELQHGLAAAGHRASFAAKTLADLGMEVDRVEAFVKRERADAWVVIGGGRGVLEWFGGQEVPTFALFGRHGGLPLAGARPDKAAAYQAAVDRLVGLGHRRIALIARKLRRLPTPGRVELAFLERLRAHGIETGAYHLPDWEDNREGFHALLGRLFQVTPPTGLIIQEAFLFHAVRQFLARQGLRVPEEVSLICTDDDDTFDWCEPPVSHIRWDSGPIIRRVVGWAAKVGRGQKDVVQTLTKAEFVEGGTIGRVR